MALKISRTLSLTAKIFKISGDGAKVVKRVRKSKKVVDTAQKGFSEIGAKFKDVIVKGKETLIDVYNNIPVIKQTNQIKAAIIKGIQKEIDIQKYVNPVANKHFKPLGEILDKGRKKLPEPNPKAIYEFIKELERNKSRYNTLNGMGKFYPFS